VSRLQYYRRIFSAYLAPGKSHLTFWYDMPRANPGASLHQLGEYYMLFSEKADYPGHHDSAAIPMLNYHGKIGLQHNPIAIAQWGLGNYNLFCQTQVKDEKRDFSPQATGCATIWSKTRLVSGYGTTTSTGNIAHR